jgi:hypothetical protein
MYRDHQPTGGDAAATGLQQALGLRWMAWNRIPRATLFARLGLRNRAGFKPAGDEAADRAHRTGYATVSEFQPVDLLWGEGALVAHRPSLTARAPEGSNVRTAACECGVVISSRLAMPVDVAGTRSAPSQAWPQQTCQHAQNDDAPARTAQTATVSSADNG